jgi:predicted acetylornithine/succinylornithine family transaminase
MSTPAHAHGTHELDTQDAVADREARFLLQTYDRAPVTIDRGQGCTFWDIEGRRYLDFITGIGVNALGYSHPRLLRIVREQAGRCLHTSNLFYHRYQGALAERLAAWSGLDRVFFSNSGTEAVEIALKAARAASVRSRTGKRRIVALHNSFHGRTMGALAVTGHPEYRQPFEPLFGDVVFVTANDREELRRAIDDDTTAVVLEVVQGEGGIHPLSAEFVDDVRTLTRRAGAWWIADETQCGLGRTGARFAYQRFAGTDAPDIVVTAKPLGGGLPLGATMFSDEAASAITRGMHGTTFGGGPLACRVALEVLDIVDGLLPQIRCTGEYFAERLHWLCRRHELIREVRHAGLMAGIQLEVSGVRFVQDCLDRGLAINCTHDTTLRLLPPLIVTAAEIDEAVGILDVVLGI